MACLLVPASEALIVSIVGKKIEKSDNEKLKSNPFFKKRKWLTKMLWGGSALLVFEHVWHGEIVPWFPFLTAANSSESFAEMLIELATVGVTMAILVTFVWIMGVIFTESLEKKWLVGKTI